MSYSIEGKIFKKSRKSNNWKLVIEGNLDFLKSLSSQRYSALLDDINFYSDSSLPKDIASFNEDSFYCYVENTPENIELLKNKGFEKKMYGNNISFRKKDIGNELDSIKVDNDISNLNMDTINKYISVNQTKTYNIDGYWYDVDSFYSAKNMYETRKKELLEKYNKLKLIESSVDYYKLSSEQKDSYLEDVSYLEEEIEDISYKIESCIKIIGILELSEFSYITKNNSDDEEEDDYDYYGNKAALYIYSD